MVHIGWETLPNPPTPITHQTMGYGSPTLQLRGALTPRCGREACISIVYSLTLFHCSQSDHYHNPTMLQPLSEASPAPRRPSPCNAGQRPAKQRKVEATAGAITRRRRRRDVGLPIQAPTSMDSLPVEVVDDILGQVD